MRRPRPDDEPLVDRIIERLRSSKKTLAVGHVNADPDAIGAATAVADAFPHVTVGAFSGLNKSAQRLVDALGVKVTIDPTVTDYETVIVCDATSASQLKCNDPSLYGTAIFMDHHQPSNFAGTPYYWSDARYKATCEMALYLIRRARAPLTERAQVALLGGLITDTGRFKFNDEDVFSSVADLLHATSPGGTRPGLYQYARALVEESDRDVSEITAQLKGLQRTQYERVGGWFVAWTVVSAFESNLSALLLSAGADVSVAFSERGLLVRGSSRASRSAADAGLNLGAIYRDHRTKVAGVKWDGGGHAAAAGFSAERSSAPAKQSATEAPLSPWADAIRKEVLAAIAAALKGTAPKTGSSVPPWDAGSPPPPMAGSDR
jgi:nanoRNase/pAp phosphatase (c-di-AMP/oligoRNAs hydrolase)